MAPAPLHCPAGLYDDGSEGGAKWFRGRIEGRVRDEEAGVDLFKVLYVDYGNSEDVPATKYATRAVAHTHICTCTFTDTSNTHRHRQTRTQTHTDTHTHTVLAVVWATDYVAQSRQDPTAGGVADHHPTAGARVRPGVRQRGQRRRRLRSRGRAFLLGPCVE